MDHANGLTRSRDEFGRLVMDVRNVPETVIEAKIALDEAWASFTHEMNQETLKAVQAAAKRFQEERRDLKRSLADDDSADHSNKRRKANVDLEGGATTDAS